MTRVRALPAVTLLLAGCGGAQASNLSHTVLDSLPGGIPRVTSPGPTAWTDSAAAVLVEEARWSGEDGSPEELGQPQSLAVDEAGTVYVVDSKPAAIKVFTPEGRLVRTLGREGEGPGEFRVGFIAARGGYLVLHDPQLARTSVWDTAGSFLRSWHSSCCYWTDIQLDRAGRIYVPSMLPGKVGDTPRGVPFVRWTLEGAAIDTVWVPWRESAKVWTVTVKSGGKNVSSMSTSVPLMPGMNHTLHPDGGIVYGWSGSYEMVRSATGKDSLRVFGRAWTPEPVTDAQRRAVVESRIRQSAEFYGEQNLRSVFKVDDVPGTLPAFMTIRVDESGRIWSRRPSVVDTTKTFYDVFDSAGAYLGPVTVPFKIREWGLQAWTREGVVAIIEDDEGRPTVVRMRLVLPGRAGR